MVAVSVFGAAEVLHYHGGSGIVSIVLLSVASAAGYGLAAVLQHRAAVVAAPELSMRAGLLVHLARRPLWLLGNALDGVGYLFQFLALRRGSLVLVEPLLVLSLVFALPVAAALDRRRVSPSEVASTGVVVAGLALFLGVARPGLGHPDASAEAWTVLSGVVSVVCVAAVTGARLRRGRPAAALLGFGSGLAFGYVAAVSERTGHLLDAGVAHALASWEPYAMVVGATAALLLTQSAFNAGDLRLSLPTLTVAQPLVAVAIGLVVFGEHIEVGGIAPVVEGLGLAMVTVGVFALGRSPVIGGGPVEVPPPT